jgi:(heptosyl)LPS beta-1,4-glucosyltransferase
LAPGQCGRQVSEKLGGSLQETTGNARANSELTAVILTLDEADNIVACVESLAWADQVVVFDSFSKDDTVALARAAGAQIKQANFQDYAQQRNAALDAVNADWIFFVDADERGTDSLGAEIRRVIQERPESGWYVPRHNFIFGRLTLGAGWYPDYQLRLFRYGRVRYERPVHEIAIVDGSIGYLENALIHHNYAHTRHFHAKQSAYVNYDAGKLKDEGIRPKVYTPFTQPLRHFWWRFVTLEGYQDGVHGLRLSLYMAYYEWVKYRKLGRLLRDENLR